MANCQPSDGQGSAQHGKYVGIQCSPQLLQKDSLSPPYKWYDKSPLIEMSAPVSKVAALP